LHEPDPQVPETQSLLQQSGLDEQLEPMLAHEGCAHVPPLQLPLQQSPAAWHGLPDASHAAAAHAPLVHVAVQQSLESAHAWPSPRHCWSAHTPPAHDWLQQSPYVVQLAPPARHLPAGTGVLPPSDPDPQPPSLEYPAPFWPPDAHPCASTAPSAMPPSTPTTVQSRVGSPEPWRSSRSTMSPPEPSA
jgi:hypothetical protein